MVNYREIIRLKALGYSQRQIASSVKSSRDTVGSVISLSATFSLSWPLPDDLTNADIEELFFPNRRISARRPIDFEYVHKELAKPGVNLTLLWAEYCEASYAENSVPYQYNQFCENYRKWARITKATMRIKRKPGDLMEVDWAGNPLSIYDSVTGDIIPAYLFVATLPCSGYTYVEAFLDHSTESWIIAHTHAYSYFDGVTRIVVPDNLKTGIITNTRYELKLNRSYCEMAEHYDTAIIPARVEHPKDKPHVERSVGYASTWISAAIRNQKHFSIHELNESILEKLNELNERPFQKREGSRLTAYMNEEKEFMKALPTSPYELAVWSTATIQSDYLITDGKNKYSVPFDLIGHVVNVRITSTTIEAFYNGSRVSSFPREKEILRNPIVKPEHMPDHHKKYLEYNEETFIEWAKSIGPNSTIVVKNFLESGKVPEQGYKSCASLSKLADRYSHQRVEDACTRALAYSLSPNIKIITTILKTGQDKFAKEEIANHSSGKAYGFTRGAGYFEGKRND